MFIGYNVHSINNDAGQLFGTTDGTAIYNVVKWLREQKSNQAEIQLMYSRLPLVTTTPLRGLRGLRGKEEEDFVLHYESNAGEAPSVKRIQPEKLGFPVYNCMSATFASDLLTSNPKREGKFASDMVALLLMHGTPEHYITLARALHPSNPYLVYDSLQPYAFEVSKEDARALLQGALAVIAWTELGTLENVFFTEEHKKLASYATTTERKRSRTIDPRVLAVLGRKVLTISDHWGP